MDKILIRGGVPLSGTIPIGGAKNAALPLMAASLLTPETLVLDNVPDLADIATMANLLVQHGVAIVARTARRRRDAGHALELSARHITSTHRALRSRPQDAGLGPRARAAGRALRPGPRVAARRLRHRHRGRSISTSRGCSGSAPRSSCAKAISRRARPRGCAAPRSCFPTRLGRRHRESADGGHAGGGRDPADQRRARAGDHRSRRLPRRHGRSDRRDRHRPPDDPRRRPAARRRRHTIIPDRIETGTYIMAAAATDGEVRLIGARLDLVAALRAHPRRRRGRGRRRLPTGSAVRRRSGPPRRGRRHDRTLSGLSDRSAGAGHGADGDRRQAPR